MARQTFQLPRQTGNINFFKTVADSVIPALRKNAGNPAFFWNLALPINSPFDTFNISIADHAESPPADTTRVDLSDKFEAYGSVTIALTGGTPVTTYTETFRTSNSDTSEPYTWQLAPGTLGTLVTLLNADDATLATVTATVILDDGAIDISVSGEAPTASASIVRPPAVPVITVTTGTPTASASIEAETRLAGSISAGTPTASADLVLQPFEASVTTGTPTASAFLVRPPPVVAVVTASPPTVSAQLESQVLRVGTSTSNPTVTANLALPYDTSIEQPTGLSFTNNRVRVNATTEVHYVTWEYANNDGFVGSSRVYDNFQSTTHVASWTRPAGRVFIRARFSTQSNGGGNVGPWSAVSIDPPLPLPLTASVSAAEPTVSVRLYSTLEATTVSATAPTATSELEGPRLSVLSVAGAATVDARLALGTLSVDADAGTPTAAASIVRPTTLGVDAGTGAATATASIESHPLGVSALAGSVLATASLERPTLLWVRASASAAQATASIESHPLTVSSAAEVPTVTVGLSEPTAYVGTQTFVLDTKGTADDYYTDPSDSVIASLRKDATQTAYFRQIMFTVGFFEILISRQAARSSTDNTRVDLSDKFESYGTVDITLTGTTTYSFSIRTGGQDTSEPYRFNYPSTTARNAVLNWILANSTNADATVTVIISDGSFAATAEAETPTVSAALPSPILEASSTTETPTASAGLFSQVLKVGASTSVPTIDVSLFGQTLSVSVSAGTAGSLTALARILLAASASTEAPTASAELFSQVLRGVVSAEDATVDVSLLAQTLSATASTDGARAAVGLVSNDFEATISAGTPTASVNLVASIAPLPLPTPTPTPPTPPVPPVPPPTPTPTPPTPTPSMPVTLLDWPTYLTPKQRGFNRDFHENKVRHGSIVGPPAEQIRSSIISRTERWRVYLNAEELKMFRMYWTRTSKYGTREARAKDPADPMRDVNLRIKSVSGYSKVTPTLWEVSFILEVLPPYGMAA